MFSGDDIALMKLHIKSSLLLKKVSVGPNHNLTVDSSKIYLNMPDYIYELYENGKILDEDINEIIHLYTELTYDDVDEAKLEQLSIKMLVLKTENGID